MQKNQIGLGLIVALVALRVGIGMHFFREGINKLREPGPFTAGFFENAAGPLASTFRNLVWDRDGLARLNRDATFRQWSQFLARVDKHYGFDDGQRQRAAQVKGRYEAQLNEHLASKADELREYRGNLTRRNEYTRDRQRMETPSLRGQIDRIESEIRSQKAPLVAPVDVMWRGYARDLNGIATGPQRVRGAVRLDKPARRVLDSESMDMAIPWFDAVIGALLIMGLLTRPAALVGAAFLFSIVAAQWPTAPGAVPSWPQAIEGLGLLVLAAAGAGQYAGFDSLFSAIFSRPRPTPRSG